MTWYLENVFRSLTLQTSVVLLSMLYITLSMCVLLVNVTFLDTQDTLAWIIMFLFLCCMVVVWSIAFSGAYKDNRDEITKASVFWSVSVLFWIGLLVWMFTNARDKRLCVGSRCPDVLWLVENEWGHSLTENQPQKTRTDLRFREIKNNIQNKGLVPQYSKAMEFSKNGVGDAIMAGNNKLSRRNDRNTTNPNFAPSPYALPDAATGGRLKKLLEFKLLDTDYINNRFCGTHSTTDDQWSLIMPIIISVLFTILSLFSLMVLISYRYELKTPSAVP